MESEQDLQIELAASARGRIMAMDSAYHVAAANRGRDVVVNASYCGVLPARFIGRHQPRASIGVDCGVGPAGAAIAGLWYLEALDVPAAVADVMSVRLGDGVDLHDHGVISVANRPATDCGVVPGMSVRDAAFLLLTTDPGEPSAEEVDHREVMHVDASGRAVVCTDSIAFGLPEDRDTNVLVTAGHTGRSAVPYLTSVHPHGFICSDGGRGRDDSGMAALALVEPLGLAGATVDAGRAAMGDGHSSYHDGVISAANAHAVRAGVAVGMAAAEAARRLVEREPDA
jgi:hypothetical protein